MCASGSGEFVAASPTPTTDRECVGCAPGFFSSAQNVGACTAATVCVPGSFVLSDPTPTTDRECFTCDEGHFSAEENAEGCTLQQECNAGQRVRRAGSSTSARVCQVCRPDAFSAAANQARCSSCATQCAGQAPSSYSCPARCAIENAHHVETGQCRQGPTSWSAGRLPALWASTCATPALVCRALYMRRREGQG